LPHHRKSSAFGLPSARTPQLACTSKAAWNITIPRQGFLCLQDAFKVPLVIQLTDDEKFLWRCEQLGSLKPVALTLAHWASGAATPWPSLPAWWPHPDSLRHLI
jgi:hypothetical protein